MKPQKGQLPILGVNLFALLMFGGVFLSRGNLEFMIYICVILAFMALILLTNDRVRYPNSVLWGLTIWSLLHMSGGGVYVDGTRLYDIILFPLSNTYPILRYDQLVHFIGFGAATLAMYYLLPDYRNKKQIGPGLAIVLVMAGLGVGGLNEIIEFGVVIVTPVSGVGDYTNIALDLVSDFLGAIAAVFYLLRKEKRAS